MSEFWSLNAHLYNLIKVAEWSSGNHGNFFLRRAEEWRGYFVYFNNRAAEGTPYASDILIFASVDNIW